MNYEDALAFISATSWQGSRLGLERVAELMCLLGEPQKELRFVHVAGTNGKGSVSAMLSAILTNAGYTTGLYTSPHLERYNERIKINGMDISDEDFCLAAEQVNFCIQQMQDAPTEFERLTAMALWHFKKENCDIVILEVGLGGRLDATNVIDAPEAAVITRLDLEHTKELGGTLREIAFEKSGIIKPGCSVVLYQQDIEAERVVRETCNRCGAPLLITDADQEELVSSDLTGQVLHYRARKNIELRLLGTYQYRNAAVVLDTVDVLNTRGYRITEDAVRTGLSGVFWPGRLEILRREPCVIVDGAHNPNGAKELARCIQEYLPDKKMIFVIGVMADKDYLAILDAIAPFAKKFIAVTPQNQRALASDVLKAEIERRFSLEANDAKTVSGGIEVALKEAGPEDTICILGSLYQVGEVCAYFKNEIGEQHTEPRCL